MYDLIHLSKVVRTGFSDMLPSLRAAFNGDPQDDRMREVYGPMARSTVFALAAAGAGAGMAWAAFGPTFPAMAYVSWPAVGAALIFAFCLRRFLFKTNGAGVDDFPWLAASLIPAISLVVLISLVSGLLDGSIGSAQDQQRLGSVLVALTNALGIAAAMTIAIAALCYRRDWLRALIDLATRLLVFRIMVWVTTLVLIDIGIVSQVLGGLIEGITGWQVPEWLAELSDRLSYFMLLSAAYLAIIGGTWIVCRRSFAELINKGNVDILPEVAKLAYKKRDKQTKSSSRQKKER